VTCFWLEKPAVVVVQASGSGAGVVEIGTGVGVGVGIPKAELVLCFCGMLGGEICLIMGWKKMKEMKGDEGNAEMECQIGILKMVIGRDFVHTGASEDEDGENPQ
jgi:hypothetical protein